MEKIKVFTKFNSNGEFIPLQSVAEIRHANNSSSITDSIVKHKIEVRIINETDFIPVDGDMQLLLDNLFYVPSDFKNS